MEDLGRILVLNPGGNRSPLPRHPALLCRPRLRKGTRWNQEIPMLSPWLWKFECGQETKWLWPKYSYITIYHTYIYIYICMYIYNNVYIYIYTYIYIYWSPKFGAPKLELFLHWTKSVDLITLNIFERVRCKPTFARIGSRMSLDMLKSMHRVSVFFILCKT